MNLPPPVLTLIIAVPMAAAIAVFFWSLDRISKERKVALEGATEPRATPRELVERLLRPAADNLSQRRSVRGRRARRSSTDTQTIPAPRLPPQTCAAENMLTRISSTKLPHMPRPPRNGVYQP